MSACGCNQSPCSCESSIVAPVTPTTLCDLDRRNNVWVEGADANGNGGICLLDTMDESQVINSLHRSQQAHDDLVRVTSNEYLRNLAATVPLHPTENAGDELQRNVNQSTIPFYAIFRGQPPFAQ